ncbi:MAG: hemolysin family protein [Bacteroidales bacterium]|jgi:CBS domain containing-hemolysin-like protein|nr:hemolysin family protein [Bacteroidales bacterium]NCU36735.1 HlyC/CorC family transporter [Candidatus Falkowbacteria bacterium]MDD3132767.1 hemolysin family protein [Bacteroidales bacterium]MDD3527044.1 hemolysin family protein [Bacteroidales bacterium]MDD4177073.1 hemolysin family protein [Bacteroidales bacterium]
MSTLSIIIITLIFSAFFSGMEIAFVSSNRLKIEVDKNKGHFSARIISHFTRMPSRFIGALLLGNNVALVIYGIAMARILEPALQNLIPGYVMSETLMLIVQTLLATFLVLVVAEFTPKVLFRLNPNKILNVFALPAVVFYYLFYPLIYIYIGFSEWVLRNFIKIKFSRENLIFSVVDLDNYLKEFSPDYTRQEDVQQEIQMFQNAIEFRNIKLRECMIPRTEIVALEKNDTIDNLRQAFITSGHSKIPVYQQSVDDIIGYVHSADMFKNPQSIQSILRPIIVAPETMPANVVLSMFIQQSKSIAVVVDEFGGTSGIITMEDVIEEIFGEIDDEFDVEDLTEKKISDNEYIFSARLEIDYLNEKYQLDLPESEDYETLAGLIISHHQSIPALDDEIQFAPFTFIILEATEARIEKVKLIISN